MTVELVQATNYDRRIARQVKLAIFDSGKQQREIALACGMHASSLSKSLQGQRPWRAEELALIARATGVDVAVLLPHLDSNQEPSDYRSMQVSAFGFDCPHCGEPLADGATRCHRCWRTVGQAPRRHLRLVG